MHRLAIALVLLLLVPAQALAQGEVKSKHGDWDLRCDTPPGAQNQQCVIMQFVTAQDRENVGLSVVVMKTADKQARILRVLAPLGVLLPRGLGLRIDNTDMGTTGFIRCLPNGCVSEVLMDDTLIRAAPRPASRRCSSSSRRRRKGSACRSRSPASARASTPSPDRADGIAVRGSDVLRRSPIRAEANEESRQPCLKRPTLQATASPSPSR